MITVEFLGLNPETRRDLEKMIGRDRLYRKGTLPGEFADFPSRDMAGLLANTIQMLTGRTGSARIVGDPVCH